MDQRVSASTQGQALSALLFLYKKVLGDPLPWLEDLVRARRPERLPVVLTPAEVRSVLERTAGLPVKDLEGQRERATILPAVVIDGLKEQLERPVFYTRTTGRRDSGWCGCRMRLARGCRTRAGMAVAVGIPGDEAILRSSGGDGASSSPARVGRRRSRRRRGVRRSGSG